MKSLRFDCRNGLRLRDFFVQLTKFSLLRRVDKALMSPKSRATLLQFGSEPSKVYEVKPKFSSQENEMVCENLKFKNPLLQLSSSNQVDSIIDYDDKYAEVSKAMNYSSGEYNEFPLNILVFLAILMFKLVGFQIGLFIKLFTFPIWLSYFGFMLFIFQFQTMSRIRANLTENLLRIWIGVYLSFTSFICNRFKAQKWVNLVTRVGWGIFWSTYACFVLVGLLVLGFIIGGFVMGRLVEEPIQTTKSLNFDYTRASPVAFVPIMSSPSAGVDVAGHVAKRVIPYNHNLLLAVSLTLPESEYNRNLGVFQVRVEFLSANGKTTASSNYPCMLRFKSQPILIAQTIFNGIPLIAGFQSQVQILNIKTNGYTEGHEPTACLRVIIEQRAEYKSGAGIPEIYSASLDLESELPRIKWIIWCWRRTIFVWIGLMSFFTELLVILIFFRRIVLPKGRLSVSGAKKQGHQNKISW